MIGQTIQQRCLGLGAWNENDLCLLKIELTEKNKEQIKQQEMIVFWHLFFLYDFWLDQMAILEFEGAQSSYFKLVTTLMRRINPEFQRNNAP